MNRQFWVWVLLAVIYSISLNGQNLLNLPESVVYDSLHCRYLVSNWGDGQLVQIDSLDIQTYFIENEHCHAGLQIVDTLLYAACREFGVRGFNLNTGQKICDVPIPEAGNINDITSDTSGFVYVSFPTESKIFKVDPVSQTYSSLVDYNLYTPNGIYFDPTLNRIIIVSYRANSPIQAFYLNDSSLQTLNYPNLHNLDGITCDDNLNYYVSSWYSNSVYVMDSSFTNPQVFATFSSDPADIYFNPVERVIAVPLIYSNQVEFIPLTTAVEESEDIDLNKINWSIRFLNNDLMVNFILESNSNIGISLFDLAGRNLQSISGNNFGPGEHNLQLSCPDIPLGRYIVRLQINHEVYCKFIMNI